MGANESIQELNQRVETAWKAGDFTGVKNACMDLFNAFAREVLRKLSERDYEAGDALLAQWDELLDKAKDQLEEKQILYGYCRHQASAGYLWESRGLEAYFLHGDYVDAPRLMEKAELCHGRSADLVGRVSLGREAPPEARQMQQNMESLQRAEEKRVRGMALLMQGEYESEAGALERAIELLKEATTTLGDAQNGIPEGPGEGALAQIMERGTRELNFIDFARALLHKALADQAVLAGDLSQAARQERERAHALERCRTMHMRAGGPLHEGFARRLARDVHVANRRHDRLAAEAGRRPRREWLKAMAFFLMSIAAAALFVWMVGRFELQDAPLVLVLLLAFVMAAAGVGARLVHWKEAANWFLQAYPRSRDAGPTPR